MTKGPFLFGRIIGAGTISGTYETKGGNGHGSSHSAVKLSPCRRRAASGRGVAAFIKRAYAHARPRPSAGWCVSGGWPVRDTYIQSPFPDLPMEWPTRAMRRRCRTESSRRMMQGKTDSSAGYSRQAGLRDLGQVIGHCE